MSTQYNHNQGRFAGRMHYIALTAAALFIALYFASFLQVCFHFQSEGTDIFANVNGKLIFDAAVLMLLVLPAIMWLTSPSASMFRGFVYRNRIIIGIILVIILTALELSGSSLGMWSSYLGEPNDGLLAGIPRSIRSDEFLVFTPFAFSQEYIGYPAVSSLLRGASTDVTMIYAQPCWAFSTLFRPFLWGYLLLGSAKGLAFFWNARLITLILVSFEMGMYLSRKNKGLALFFATVLSFSPVIQWWFSINGLVEMLIFGQGLVLAFHRMLREDRLWKSVVLSLLIAWMGESFLLVIYPAWQVPLFWIFVSLAVTDSLDFAYEQMQSSPASAARIFMKRVAPLLISALLIISFSAVCFLPVADVISIETATEYPGQRSSNGGGTIAELFYGTSGLFNALRASESPMNASEGTGFFFLFPLGVVSSCLSLLNGWRKKGKVKPTVVPVLIAELAMLVYCVVGFPGFLSKVTLMSHSTALRTAQMIGLADLALFVMCYEDGFFFKKKLDIVSSDSNAESKKCRKSALALCAVVFLGVIAFCHFVFTLRLFFCAMLGLLALVCLATCLSGEGEGMVIKKVIPITLVIICMGLCVNPVQKGTGPLLNGGASSAIQKISSSEDDALWAADNNWLGQLCVSSGAPCINSVNTYPVLDRWAELDSSVEAEHIYNRYAHITIKIDEGAPKFEYGIAADQFTLTINADALSGLGVDYFVSARSDLGECGTSNTSFELVENVGPVYIWKVVSADKR